MTVNRPRTRGDTSSAGRTSDSPDDQNETSHGVSERSSTREDVSPVAVDELFDLLGDEYVADILRALSDGEMPARAIADECGMSRSTAYRRLDRLTEAGIVASRLRPESGGHHRQEYRLVLEAVAVRFRADGFDGHVHVRKAASD